jgi:phosphoglycerate dehydrogenase-like enzyme
MLGLVALGHIRRAVARRAVGFDMRTIAVSTHPEPHPDLFWRRGFDRLDEFLSPSDFVVIASPLSAQIRKMIGERELRPLKSNAYLINPVRAEIIDETALHNGLREGWFAGVALDVWYRYPRKSNLQMHGSHLPFHQLDNILATPHFSAWSREMIETRYRRLLKRSAPASHCFTTCGSIGQNTAICAVGSSAVKWAFEKALR